MQDPHTPARRFARRLAFACSPVLVLCLGAAAAPELSIRELQHAGVPRAVAECMYQAGAARGSCEVGMFTGTYPDAFDRDRDLAAIRDAVRSVPARGGRWIISGAIVCADVPHHPRRCAPDVTRAVSGHVAP